jgi:hypothetical protein
MQTPNPKSFRSCKVPKQKENLNQENKNNKKT